MLCLSSDITTGWGCGRQYKFIGASLVKIKVSNIFVLLKLFRQGILKFTRFVRRYTPPSLLIMPKIPASPGHPGLYDPEIKCPYQERLSRKFQSIAMTSHNSGLNTNPENAENGFQGYFWKRSTRPDDFLGPNCLYSDLTFILGSAVWLSPGVDASIINRFQLMA